MLMISYLFIGFPKYQYCSAPVEKDDVKRIRLKIVIGSIFIAIVIAPSEKIDKMTLTNSGL